MGLAQGQLPWNRGPRPQGPAHDAPQDHEAETRAARKERWTLCCPQGWLVGPVTP